MSKHWDNEPTPLTDANTVYETPNGFVRIAQNKPYVMADFARNLERRIRHAEKLLEHALDHSNVTWPFTAKNIEAHLEATKKENKQ